jgi:hypothetical protein
MFRKWILFSRQSLLSVQNILSTLVNKMATTNRLAQEVDASAFYSRGSDIGRASTILRIVMTFPIFPEKIHSNTLI